MRDYNLKTVFDFGKYKNHDVEYVISKDINYIVWCIIEIKDIVFTLDVINLLELNFNQIISTNDELTDLFINNLPKKKSEDRKLSNIIKTNALKMEVKWLSENHL